MQKQLLTARQSSFLYLASLAVSGYVAATGAIKMLTNPQIVTDNDLQMIYDYGQKKETFTRYRDTSGVANGFIQTGLGLSMAVLSSFTIGKPKPKLINTPQPINLMPPGTVPIPDLEIKAQEKLEKKNAVFKHALTKYIEKIFIQCPWILECMGAPVIVHVGEPGAGKSRTAMSISICQIIKNGIAGSFISILDTQGDNNIQDNTWIAGTIYNQGHINSDFIDFVTGEGRNKKSPFRSTIIDEAGRLSKNADTVDLIEAVMNSDKDTGRKRNQCTHYTAHSLMKAEFGGDRLTGVRAPLFKAAMFICYPKNVDREGKPIKTDVVFIRQGWVDGDPIPRKVGKEYVDTQGWTQHILPDWLDPAVFAKELATHITAIGLYPRIAPDEAATAPINTDAQTAELNRKVAPESAVMQVLAVDVPRMEAIATQHDIALDFAPVGGVSDVYMTLEELRTCSEEEQDFIRNSHKPLDISINNSVVYDVKRLRDNWGKRRFDNMADFRDFLATLAGKGYGILSASGKYWIHPFDPFSNDDDLFGSIEELHNDENNTEQVEDKSND